jgi:hypothetical protein
VSVEASAWAFRQSGLKSGGKLLLVAIANRADKSGVAFPGRKSLAEDCCCEPETVTQNFKALERAGLIARFDRRRENGSRTSNWIVLAPSAADREPMVDADVDELPSEVAKAAQSSGEETQPEKSTGEETSGEDRRPGQVRKTGGPPELSGEPGSGSPAKAGDPDPVGSANADPTGQGVGTEETTATNAPKVKRSAAETNKLVRELFDFWRTECEHPRAQLSDERRAKLKARLKDSTPKEIGKAIRGAARAAYVNEESGKRFDELTLICRNRSKLEDFIERYELSQQKGGADAARKRQTIADDTRARIEESKR